tara:strand:+ start:2310 stop:3014 length:705 start_codon:yes stop_codon:yes gene_type:complete
MAYLRELPSVIYPSPLSHKNSSQDSILVKNLFRKAKLQQWLSDSVTVFNKAYITDGARPDTIAESLYGSPDLDYVVVICARITNITDQWPLSSKDLYNYSIDKYGIQGLNEIHHYETIEVKDEKERLILPKGKVVDDNYKLDGPRKRSLSATWKGYKDSGEVEIYKTEEISPIIGISNYEFEITKNEKKREIDVLNRVYVSMFLQDLRNSLSYSRSSNYISKSLIKTTNNSINP